MLHRPGRRVLDYVNPNGPINWACNVNSDLTSWHVNLPHSQWGGGKILRDLNRGFQNDGTLTNGPLWKGSSGRPGGYGSIFFDGVDDSVLMNRNTAITGNAAYSIAAWIWPTAIDVPMAVAGFGDGGTALTATCFMIGVAAGPAGSFGSGAGNVSLEFGGANGGRTGTNVFAEKEWTHLCVVKTPGAINTTTSIYVNGSAVSLSTSSTNTPNITAGVLAIGQFTANTANNLFSGMIDDVRIYSRALSADVVRALFSESKAGYPNAMRWLLGRTFFLPSGGGSIFRSGILRSRIIQGVAGERA